MLGLLVQNQSHRAGTHLRGKLLRRIAHQTFFSGEMVSANPGAVQYVHNLPCSKNVQDELRAVEKTARVALTRYPSGQDINIFAEEISEAELERLYMQAERTVIVTDEITTTVPDAIEIKETDWTSVVATVSGSWLYDLYHRYKTDLFSANLRGYLASRESDSNINNGIKTTADAEPRNFYVYNNGHNGPGAKLRHRETDQRWEEAQDHRNLYRERSPDNRFNRQPWRQAIG